MLHPGGDRRPRAKREASGASACSGVPVPGGRFQYGVWGLGLMPLWILTPCLILQGTSEHRNRAIKVMGSTRKILAPCAAVPVPARQHRVSVLVARDVGARRVSSRQHTLNRSARVVAWEGHKDRIPAARRSKSTKINHPQSGWRGSLRTITMIVPLCNCIISHLAAKHPPSLCIKPDWLSCRVSVGRCQPHRLP